MVKLILNINGCFSFCLVQYSLKFSQEQNKFWLGDKLLPSFKHGFLRSEENVNLNNFQPLMVYDCWSTYSTSVHKIAGHTNTDTPLSVGNYLD